MELTDYIRILRKSWLAVLVLTALGAGAAAAYTFTLTPVYKSSATVFVSTQAGGTAAELQQGSTFTQARINTYVGLATAPIVLDPVIARLGLRSTASELAKDVEASAQLNSTLITVTVSSSDSSEAANIANAIAQSLSSTIPELEPASNDGSSPVRLSRVRDAEPPSQPSSPNVALNIALGGIIGLAVALAASVLRAVLDTRVRTTRDAEQITGAPSIGAIAFDSKAKERPLIVHADPLSPRAESFRALRTNLQFLDMGGRSSFVITSSIPSEGKTSTAINLAIALADAGKRVALLDTDLRMPKVAEYLGIEGAVGLTDVLIGRASVADVMLPWGGRSLYVLPAGKIPPNPSELLGSHQMGSLLEMLEREFDVVLCDAPPLLPVTDAAVLSRATSGALMVVSVARTTRNQLAGATDALTAVGAKLAGFVLSMVPTRGADSYYAGYGYGYGYGYGVRSSKQQKRRKPGKPTTQKSRKRDDSRAPEPSTQEHGFVSRRESRETQRET